MDNILWENTCYDIDDFYAGNLYQELKMCDKCCEVIEKGGYELCRVNMKPDFWIISLSFDMMNWVSSTLCAWWLPSPSHTWHKTQIPPPLKEVGT